MELLLLQVSSMLAICLQIAVQMMKLAVVFLAVISLNEPQPFLPSFTSVNYTVTTGAEVCCCWMDFTSEYKAQKKRAIMWLQMLSGPQ